MISYFDTSALVKNYVEEAGSDDVRKIVLDTLPATSRLTGIELASSVARRCREGDLSRNDSDKILSEVREDLTALYVVELTPDVEKAAQELLFRHSLRASDAAHLASCLVLREHLDVRCVSSPMIDVSSTPRTGKALKRSGVDEPRRNRCLAPSASRHWRPT